MSIATDALGGLGPVEDGKRSVPDVVVFANAIREFQYVHASETTTGVGVELHAVLLNKSCTWTCKLDRQ